ncbi:hypothetical protein QOZ80_1BG0087730 [Eleusine coracana subsp. coracana]|nr:hypothetical protein QOZ80_1BG0087730 [Eleusine coracana subsp. coracana]
MEMPHSTREVQAARNSERRRICRDGAESGGLIPSHLEKLFKEMREKGDEFATQRWAWENGRGKRFGSFEDTTVVPPMCYTSEYNPKYAIPDRTLQVFSVEVAELHNDLKWPLQVYGFIAVRDSIDPRRNLLFQRDRSNCQTITEKEPFLQLTGPSRAVVIIDPVSFEIQLKMDGGRIPPVRGSCTPACPHIKDLVVESGSREKSAQCLLPLPPAGRAGRRVVPPPPLSLEVHR